MLESLRQEVASTARALAGAGLVAEAQGNVSAREGDLVAVTGTGVRLAAATSGDVSVVDRDGQLLEGPPPSSELLVHLAIYDRFGAGAVVHGHVLPRPGAAPVAPWAPEGSAELADAVVAALAGGATAVVMERHGTVAHGPDLATALRRTRALTASSAGR